MPLQAAEQWIAMVTHQAKVTSHNLRILMSQHKPMESHLRTMRRIARQQAKNRKYPVSPRSAVQAAVKSMRDKLYASRTSKRRSRQPATNMMRNSLLLVSTQEQRAINQGGNTSVRATLRHHPP